ncbi:hypothetical protein [Pseudomonas sp. GM80]|uniref:hypothetical protein n=1 Tax=Pseudomonas sp. GM80 TaxID=1144339 RepID=UPI0012F705A7|nr:hypothetical protein [Pseudomonas sp. GM80]
MKASFDKSKSKSKTRTFSSVRDLAPSLMDWCASEEGQAATRKLKNKKTPHTSLEASPATDLEKPGTQLSMF